MLDLEHALPLGNSLVVAKKPHQDHAHTVEMRRRNKAFVTGEGLDYMVQRFDKRESEEDFTQMMRIVQFVTKPITAALIKPAEKVTGVRPVVDRIDYGKANDEKAAELRTDLSTFYGGEGLDAFMGTLVVPSDVDPNAFVVLTFDPFDHRKEKPTMYPVQVPSENVWGFEYLNGELEYLFLAFDIEYVKREAVLNADGTVLHPAEKAPGKRFVLYTHDHHIVYEQVRKELAPTGAIKGYVVDAAGNIVVPMVNAGIVFHQPGSELRYFLKVDDEVVYEVRFFDQKSGAVPAFRLGCKLDPLTDGRTCVNRWDEAVPYLKKSLKQVRELDLSTALHVFMQKLQYVGPCRAKDCNKGYLPDGSTECSACKGTGETTIGTGMDHITIRMPKNPADPMFELEKLVHYVQMPIEIVQQLRDIVKENRADAFRSVYGSDLYGQGNVGKTYEEVLAMNEGMYDALQPFSKWYSLSRSLSARVYAAYTDRAEKLQVVHKLPRSFGFETVATVFGAMKGAGEAGASKAIAANLNDTALEILFRDDPEALKKARTQARFDPFPGMDVATISGLITGGKTTEESAMLWTESAKVYRLAEEKYPGDVDFYDLAESKQAEVIDEIVDQLLEEKREAAMENAPQFDPLTGLEEGGDPEGASTDEGNKGGGELAGPIRGERGGTYFTRPDGSKVYR